MYQPFKEGDPSEIATVEAQNMKQIGGNGNNYGATTDAEKQQHVANNPFVKVRDVSFKKYVRVAQ